MRALKTSQALCIDLELTCWDGDPPPGMRPEIIEIGIVELDMQRREIVREAEYLVTPVMSEISEYCTELTGITPEEVAQKGRPLGEVMRSLANQFGPKHKSLISWGRDWSGIERDCVSKGVENPFPAENQLNVGQLASLAAGADRRLGLNESLLAAGLDPGATRHRGLVDARNTGRLVFVLADALSAVLPGYDASVSRPGP